MVYGSRLTTNLNAPEILASAGITLAYTAAAAGRPRSIQFEAEFYSTGRRFATGRRAHVPRSWKCRFHYSRNSATYDSHPSILASLIYWYIDTMPIPQKLSLIDILSLVHRHPVAPGSASQDCH